MRRLIPALAALMLLSGCMGRDGVDGPVEMSATNIVTFLGNRPDGSDFELLADGDGPSTLLHASRGIDSTRAIAGDRVLISYTGPDDQGRIDLLGAGTVFNDTLLRVSRSRISELDADPVWLMAAWRTGSYINVRARLDYSDKPRVWALVVDSATVGNAVPQLALLHRLPKGVTPDSTWMSMTYSSFNIGWLWKRPEVEAIEINVRNSNLTSLTTLRFEK